jgi:hypothetical protein
MLKSASYKKSQTYPKSASCQKSASNIRAVAITAFLGLMGAAIIPVRAQNAPGVHQENGGLNGSLSRGDLEKLSGDHSQDAGADAAKQTPQARAKAKTQSEKLLAGLGLPCDVSDAQLVVSGTRKPAAGGRAIETSVYEAACQGAMGYLLETQGAENPIAISCLSAEEARAADVSKGKQPGFYCKLPENKDVYAMVASLIAANAGTTCEVTNVQLFGRSASSQSEYSEIVCKDGKGFLLGTALPGTQSKTTAMSCADAAKQGIKCRLTDAGPVEIPVTLETFKSALAQHGVSCNIAQIRMIGQETHLKRYVVEYRCADQPAGMIAYLPLEGNTNPYETSDCNSAASLDVVCTFNRSN